MSKETTTLRPEGKLLVGVGAATFLALALVNAPASFLAPAIQTSGAAVQYKELRGTIWRGEVAGVSTGEQYLGDIAYELKPLSLLTGALSADVAARGGAAVGEGRIAASLFGGQVMLENATFEFDLASVERYSLFGIPYEGRVRGKFDRVAWSRDGCAAAAGHVWTDVLDASSKRLVGDGLVLAGPASCDDRALRLDLAGANREGETVVKIAVNADLTYQVTASVDPSRAEIANNLRSLGFEANDGVLVYDAVGALKGAGI